MKQELSIGKKLQINPTETSGFISKRQKIVSQKPTIDCHKRDHRMNRSALEQRTGTLINMCSSVGKGEFARVLGQKKTSEVSLGKSNQKLNAGKLQNADFVSPVSQEPKKG